MKGKGPIQVMDVLTAVEHLLHLPITLDATVDTEGVQRFNLTIGDWEVSMNSQIYAIRQKVAHLLLTGWTGWDLHHCHTTCALHHDARHNGRSFSLDYVSEGQLLGLVIHRAELSPLSCALAPVPGELNRVLSCKVMGSKLLGPVLTALNSINEAVDRDLWEDFVEISRPLSMERLGLTSPQSRDLWEESLDRIELAHLLVPGI